MALPADGQNANGLTKVTQIPAGKELMFIDPTTNEGGIITLEDLTKQILNGLTSQTFGLDSGTQTLPAAINYLYGKVKRCNVSAGKTATFTYGNYATVSIIIIKSGIFIYSNGYLTEISNDKSVKAEISSNYKTITITNNMLGESAYGMAIFSNIIPGIVVE